MGDQADDILQLFGSSETYGPSVVNKEPGRTTPVSAKV